MNQTQTSQLEEKLVSIIKSFQHQLERKRPFSKDEQDYLLIVQTILNNLSGSAQCWSKGLVNEGRILIRSAFEALILGYFLTKWPEELDAWRLERLELDFKYICQGYLRQNGSIDIHGLLECYQNIPDAIKDKIRGSVVEVDQGPKIIESDKFFKDVEQFKPSATHTYGKLNRLVEAGFLDSGFLDYCYPEIYIRNAQISHSSYGGLKQSVKDYQQDPNSNEGIKDCIRQTAVIIMSLEKAIPIMFKRHIQNEPINISAKMLNLLQSAGITRPNL